MNEEQRITVCKTSTSRITTMLSTSPQDYHSYLPLARQITAHLDATTFMSQTTRTAEQTWIIASLQRLAFIDADNGGVLDIAAWCSRQWLLIVQRDALNVGALKGLGQIWLARAQPALARIQQGENDASGDGSVGSNASTGGKKESKEKRAAEARQEAERRAGSADYVEARGMVQPASEYLERAVRTAGAQKALSGDLLVTAAEAYMSLGNVSGPRASEPHFKRAVQLLRAASAVPGYTLPAHLQQYGSMLNEAQPTPTPDTANLADPLANIMTAPAPQQQAQTLPSMPTHLGSSSSGSRPFFQVQLLSPTAKAPTRGSTFAAGHDIYASKAATIPARNRALVDTDISVAVPPNTYGRVAPRSGLAVKHGIDVGAGVIDADYRGQVKVLLFNLTDEAFEVQAGDRIAQLILEVIVTPEVMVVDKLPETVRGAGGFGSTGGFGAPLVGANGAPGSTLPGASAGPAV
ncbi:hypothetical protein MBLNU230_g4964t1 [Neophaeotheca triangularis]